MIIRKAIEDDAKIWFEFMSNLDKETNYMLYEEGERKNNEKIIENLIKNKVKGKDLLLVADDNGDLAGFLSASINKVNRVKHVAYIVCGIRKQYRGQGIGTRFFQELDAWALENSLRRLELTVVCENKVAVKLYEKSGFVIEGIQRKSFCLNGKYLDQYYMGKLI